MSRDGLVQDRWRALRDLKRQDIGGKTGTTNSSKDAWFSGYGANIVATAWIGFDDSSRNLGRTAATGGEAGAKTAQPIWNDFMKVALEGVPVQMMPMPKALLLFKSIAIPVSWREMDHQ